MKCSMSRPCSFAHHLVDIGRIVPVAVGPVLQIEIDLQALFLGVVDGLLDVCCVLREASVELVAAVLFAALGQQIDHLAAGFADPVYAALEIHEAEHLDPLGQADPLGPFDDIGDRLLLALGDPRGGHFDTVHLELFEQRLGDVQLLAG